MNVSAGSLPSVEAYGLSSRAKETDKLSVLVLSPDPAVHGGVSVFIETMKSHLMRVQVTSLWVGSIQGQKEYFPALAWRLLTLPLRVLWRITRQKIDVVHINPSLDFKSALRDGLILLALRAAGFNRVLVYFHGYDLDFGYRMNRNPVVRALAAWALGGAHRIAVLSPQCQALLEDMGVRREKIICTRTMFDGALLKHTQAETSARRTILYMSRFERSKGCYELIDAFARIAKEFSDVDLIMAGDGSENKQLRARVSELGLTQRIAFPGYVTGEVKAKLLSGCTLFALPSFLEGMPVSLLEAMGAGKPLLTSNVGAIEDIVREPENGIVLKEVSVDTVEKALRRLLSDSEYCRATGLHNAGYAWSRFEATSVTAEIEALYQSIACT